MTPRNGLVCGVVLGAVLAAGACAQEGKPAATGEAQGAGQVEFATADALLAALEKADEKLETLTADVRYEKTFELQGDRQVRTGKLYFVNGEKGTTGGKGRKFAVSFEKLQVGEVVREEPKVYIFDGQWLVEKLPKEKPPLFIKRQVVAPGQTADPLRIGEGPFPLPIGQKAAEIKERYEVELLPAGAGLEPGKDDDEEQKATLANLGKFVAGGAHVKLTPKARFAEDEDFTRIDLWYRRDKAGMLLPRMARTVDKAKNQSVVQLINVQVQREGEAANTAARVPPEALDTAEPARGSGWEVQVVPWQKPAADGAGAGGKREGPEAGDP